MVKSDRQPAENRPRYVVLVDKPRVYQPELRISRRYAVLADKHVVDDEKRYVVLPDETHAYQAELRIS